MINVDKHKIGMNCTNLKVYTFGALNYLLQRKVYIFVIDNQCYPYI